METVVTVLSSSISCKVLRFPEDEVLMIGSSISRRNCADLLEASCDVLGKLEKHGGFSFFCICVCVCIYIYFTELVILLVFMKLTVNLT